MSDTDREVTLASLAKAARGTAVSWNTIIDYVKSLGDNEDTKLTFIDNYAAGLANMKAANMAGIRLKRAPGAKPNAHGNRTHLQHKAIRAAEVAWVRIRKEAGFKSATTDPRAANARRKPTPPAGEAPNAEESRARPMALEAVTLPTACDASEALAWINQLTVKARSFRNQNAKLFDTLGASGSAIRDALTALADAIKAAQSATAKPTVVQPRKPQSAAKGAASATAPAIAVQPEVAVAA